MVYISFGTLVVKMFGVMLVGRAYEPVDGGEQLVWLLHNVPQVRFDEIEPDAYYDRILAHLRAYCATPAGADAFMEAFEATSPVLDFPLPSGVEVRAMLRTSALPQWFVLMYGDSQRGPTVLPDFKFGFEGTDEPEAAKARLIAALDAADRAAGD